MGQSLVKLITHITFSTKHRQPLIDASIEPELHAYLGGLCKELECTPIAVGGFTDHVHIVCQLSKKIALVDLMEELKKRSSKWVKTKGDRYDTFYWQQGYGAFSVNPADLDKLIDYVNQQHTHHRNLTFQEEYRRFLNELKIDYDERYVWD